ncbi:hypothetical protein Y1Q_0008524 [Alligator mississippiensis]|uniref:Uncharacterized protein n=1 Tax=Alligator mississippiensis TaxID=8496 RepID=A0A151M1L2_ALLMI|nr:hypothetical protein Y1Q_0008524 [Alligator mississippiensis]
MKVLHEKTGIRYHLTEKGKDIAFVLELSSAFHFKVNLWAFAETEMAEGCDRDPEKLTSHTQKYEENVARGSSGWHLPLRKMGGKASSTLDYRILWSRRISNVYHLGNYCKVKQEAA